MSSIQNPSELYILANICSQQPYIQIKPKLNPKFTQCYICESKMAEDCAICFFNGEYSFVCNICYNKYLDYWLAFEEPSVIYLCNENCFGPMLQRIFRICKWNGYESLKEIYFINSIVHVVKFDEFINRDIKLSENVLKENLEFVVYNEERDVMVLL